MKMRIVLLLLIISFSTVVSANSALQTDWSGGPGTPGPIGPWGSVFDVCTNINYDTSPGILSLSLPYGEHNIDNEIDHPKALEFFRSALEIQRLQDSSWGLPDTLSNMGMTMKELGDYPEALSLYREALELRRKSGGRARIGNILNNIGNLHSATGDYSQSLDTHKQSLAVRLALGNNGDIARSIRSGI